MAKPVFVVSVFTSKPVFLNSMGLRVGGGKEWLTSTSSLY